MRGVVVSQGKFHVAAGAQVLVLEAPPSAGDGQMSSYSLEFVPAAGGGGEGSGEGERVITELAVSRCARYVYAAFDKTVVCWDTKSREVIAQSELKKRVKGLVCSTYEGKQILFVLDKSGDILVSDGLKLASWADAGAGHTTSVITDMIVMEGEKMFISCDRDEKIRVCSCPDIYRVISYCLGHRDVISSICEVSGKGIVVSAGWDHKLCLWNAADGKLLCMTSTKDRESEGEGTGEGAVQATESTEAEEGGDEAAAEGGEEGDGGDGDGDERTYSASDAGSFPSKVRMVMIDNKQYVGVIFNDSNKFSVYSTDEGRLTEAGSVEWLKASPVDFACSGNKLLFLLPPPFHLQIFEIVGGEAMFKQCSDGDAEQLAAECRKRGADFPSHQQSLGADPEGGKRALHKHTIKRKFTEMLRGEKRSEGSAGASKK